MTEAATNVIEFPTAHTVPEWWDGTTLDQMLETGASYRQLDYWTRCGILRPRQPQGTGSGKPRWWSYRDLRVADLMLRLYAAGIDPRRAGWMATGAVDHGAYEHTIQGVTILIPDDTERTPE